MRQKDLLFLLSVGAVWHDTGSPLVRGVVGVLEVSVGQLFSGLEVNRVCSLVAGIQGPTLPAHKQPAEAAGDGFQEVPRIERVDDRLDAKRTALVDYRTRHIWIQGVTLRVRLPFECEQVQYGENSHFDSDEQVWNRNLEISVSHRFSDFDGAGRYEEGDEGLHRLVG